MAHRRPNGTVRTIGVALVVVLVVLSGCTGGGGSGGGDGGEAPAAAAGDSPSGGSGSGGSGGGSGTGANARAVGSHFANGDRVVVRRAEMTLRVDDYETAFERARSIARDHGGYVGDREQTGDGAYDEGYFVVTVPAREFSAVRDALAGVGTVTGEHVEALDFTSTYRNATDRLERLRADERRLERALERAGANASELRAELEEVRSEIDAVTARRERLQRRSSTSTIRVRVHEPVRHRPPRNAVGVSGLVDGYVDAFRTGMTVLRDVLAVIGFGVPTALAGATAALCGLVALELSWRGWSRLGPHLRVPGRVGRALTGRSSDGSGASDRRRGDGRPGGRNQRRGGGDAGRPPAPTDRPGDEPRPREGAPGRRPPGASDPGPGGGSPPGPNGGGPGDDGSDAGGADRERPDGGGPDAGGSPDDSGDDSPGGEKSPRDGSDDSPEADGAGGGGSPDGANGDGHDAAAKTDRASSGEANGDGSDPGDGPHHGE